MIMIMMMMIIIIIIKYKVHPRTGHKGPEEEKRYSSTLSLTSALEGRFNPGKGPLTIV